MEPKLSSPMRRTDPGLGRRLFAAGALAGMAGALAACQTTGSSQQATATQRDAGPDPSRPVTLVYIRSAACPYCLDWERWQEPAWLASPLRAKVTYRVLDFPHFSNITADSGWPEDLRWIRAREGLTRGTPRYIVVREREVLVSALGTGSWGRQVLPVLERATA